MDVLVVDDDAGVRLAVACSVRDAGHRVSEAGDGAEALRLAGEHVFDVAVCDVRLPKVDGLTVFRRLHTESPRTAVILMTAFANVNDAVSALKEGAYDYVTKPFDVERLTSGMLARIAEQRRLEQDLREAREQLLERGTLGELIGRSPGMQRLRDLMDAVARSDAPVLLRGESGTGKELVARMVHRLSARHARPFVAVNCAALPETLLEAELFGHERGAFTGAVRRREGRFKMANGGTLLLDEVAEMSPSAQVKLLRVLQEGAIEPVGSSASIQVDVRVLSATHQDLRSRIADGRFREDLYYRLNVLDLTIPPLRERMTDLPILFEHFARSLTPEGSPPPRITARAWARLCKHSYPGNVRELAHIVERAIVLSRGEPIDLPHLPSEIAGADEALGASPARLEPLGKALREFEHGYILQALRLCGGKRARAAELLGISRKHLWEKLRGYAEVPLDAGEAALSEGTSE